ncbi:Dyp-type peroxidase [Paracoccus caeni]|uniref:Dyp-type peroxidase n=1 Tax=Paracoccus caeni TaxID=657651 RepID=A0A934SHU6_9RHOB|nr:Dyp-type peroxidase [Paracoccus caeni]MBK4215662.1 Dyp-type peroxidase [Paracoccus caeni]
MPPVTSQPVENGLTRAAIFLVVTLKDSPEVVPTLQSLLADLAGIVRGVGFRISDGELSCVAGIGSDAWGRLFPGPRPRDLHPFAEIDGVHRAVSTPGDVLFHIRASRMDLCFELATHLMARIGAVVTVEDETHGFKYFDDRDLIGFVDGTENPTGDDRVQATLIGDEDPGFRGGSYVIVQKYLHDLAAWEKIPVEQQERIIGRKKLSDIELLDADKPPYAHNVLTSITDEDGNALDILRDNMPFGRPGAGEYGTYFIGYAKTPAVTERMLHNMFVGNPPGTYDRLLDVSRAVTGTLFFVPPASMLEDAGSDAAVAKVPARGEDGRAKPD